MDCYRYYNGVPYRGAFPIVAEFKSRKEKEQLLWRSKDRLRKINIVVTDDIALRQNAKTQSPNSFQLRQDQVRGIKNIPESPKKREKEKVSAEQKLFEDFI